MLEPQLRLSGSPADISTNMLEPQLRLSDSHTDIGTDMLEPQLRLSDSHPDIGTDIKPQFRLPGFDADFQHGPSHTTASSDAPILRVVRPLPGSERQPSSVHGGVRISPHDQEPFCDLPPGSSPASADCQPCRNIRPSTRRPLRTPYLADLTDPGGTFGTLPRPPEQCQLPEVSSIKFTDTGDAFGSLPRPPEFPLDTTSWTIDLCQPTTYAYMDDIVTITFDGLSIVYVTTVPNRHSPYTHKYIYTPNELARDFIDSDSDDDIPDLMDPDNSDSDDDMPDLGFSVAQAA